MQGEHICDVMHFVSSYLCLLYNYLKLYGIYASHLIVVVVISVQDLGCLIEQEVSYYTSSEKIYRTHRRHPLVRVDMDDYR
jgi:hypothetical protein